MEAGYEEMQLGTDKIEFFVFFTIILRHLKWVLSYNTQDMTISVVEFQVRGYKVK